LLHSHRILQAMNRIRTTKSHLAIPLLLLCTVVLQGCGQKGPLYLPDEPQLPAETENSESTDT
jgi:predicted small lipoprotein YifL